VATLGVPLDRAGRVIVERDLSIPGHPEVFVVGDASAFLHQDGTPLPGVAQTAMQGATQAASNILHLIRGEPTQTFVYKNLGNMAIVGRGSAVADLPWAQLRGVIGWLAWLSLHIVTLIGFRNRVVVLFEWAMAYFTFQRGARLITGESEGLRPQGSGLRAGQGVRPDD
jgi:NADH dehydrogenase